MKLNEVVIPSNDQMTNVQQIALLSIYLAGSTSAESAAEAIKGDDKKMAAGEYLIHKGFIVASTSGISVTQQGLNALMASGLIQQGQVTAKGRQLINPPKPIPQPSQPQPNVGGIT